MAGRTALLIALALAACSSGGDKNVSRGDGSDAAVASAETARRKIFVDVRTPEEFAAGHVDGAINIPHTEMPERWRELEPHRGDSLIVYCRTGRRSAIALEVLESQGFPFTRNAGSLENARGGR